MLEAAEVKEASKNSCTIGKYFFIILFFNFNFKTEGKHYELKLKKKFFCPSSFSSVLGISLGKLYSVVKQEEKEQISSSTTISLEYFQNRKMDTIKTFLSGLWSDDAYSENDPSNPLVRRLSSFQNMNDVFNLYCELCIESNESSQIPNFAYFRKFWQDCYPHLGFFFIFYFLCFI